jgi:hypothetical protein
MKDVLRHMTGEELLLFSIQRGKEVFATVDAELDRRAKAARTRRLSEGRQGAAWGRIGVRPAVSLTEAA